MAFMDKAGPLQPIIEPVVQKLLGTVVDMKVINICRVQINDDPHNFPPK